jgi:hypothetical protein
MIVDPFVWLCRASGLPDPVPEWRFAPPRRWKFDYAFVPALVAVEQEGAIWVQGRHTRGTGYVNDLEKYNHAALRGWCVLRFTPEQIQTQDAVRLVRSALVRRWSDCPMSAKDA